MLGVSAMYKLLCTAECTATKQPATARRRRAERSFHFILPLQLNLPRRLVDDCTKETVNSMINERMAAYHCDNGANKTLVLRAATWCSFCVSWLNISVQGSSLGREREKTDGRTESD